MVLPELPAVYDADNRETVWRDLDLAFMQVLTAPVMFQTIIFGVKLVVDVLW